MPGHTTHPIAVRLWRDHDAEARTLPGMDLGSDLIHAGQPTMDTAYQLYTRGVRRLGLDAQIDLTDGGQAPHELQALALVRDLSSLAIVVDWRLSLDPAKLDQWETLSHLWPPSEVLGPADGDDVLRRWRQQHYVGKCVHRRGPGFIQVRDRRWGSLRRLTIDEPGYLSAVTAFSSVAESAAAAEYIVDDLTAARLVLPIGDLVLWLPCQSHRWFHSTMFM